MHLDGRHLLVEWALCPAEVERLDNFPGQSTIDVGAWRAMRDIGATKAPPQPTSNAQVFCGQTQTLQKYRHGFGAGRRLSMSGSRIGRF